MPLVQEAERMVLRFQNDPDAEADSEGGERNEDTPLFEKEDYKDEPSSSPYLHLNESVKQDRTFLSDIMATEERILG